MNTRELMDTLYKVEARITALEGKAEIETVPSFVAPIPNPIRIEITADPQVLEKMRLDEQAKFQAQLEAIVGPLIASNAAVLKKLADAEAATAAKDAGAPLPPDPKPKKN